MSQFNGQKDFEKDIKLLSSQVERCNEEESDTENNKDQKKDEETEASLDSDYDIDEYKLDEQLVDTDSDKHNNEQVIQKNKLYSADLEYKIFTNQYDEIIKAQKEK